MAHGRRLKARFKRGDEVTVLSGDEAGKSGKILQMLPSQGRAVVEGLNLVTKHMRKTQDNPQGGRPTKEAPLRLCKLALKEQGKGAGATGGQAR
ncbi:MAG: 50S ribosomal protein L24 [Candidatus Marinimicrobia bacterium]|nr:50S ribosomal protein L24 [Candidatus Neomarinimicrobiota bacterium]